MLNTWLNSLSKVAQLLGHLGNDLRPSNGRRSPKIYYIICLIILHKNNNNKVRLLT